MAHLILLGGIIEDTLSVQVALLQRKVKFLSTFVGLASSQEWQMQKKVLAHSFERCIL